MRLNVLAMAGGLAIAGNWLRVLTIILAGHYTDMQHYIVSQSHYYFGWGVFGVMMVIFFLWERRLPGAPPASGQTIPPGAILTRPGALAHVVAAAGLFGLLRLAASTPSEQSWLPESVAGWRRAGADAGFAPRLAGIDASRVFRYTASAAAVDYYEGLYTSQKQGKEFSAFGSDLSPGQQVAESAQRKVGALPVTMLHMRNSSGADNVMAVSYRVGDRDFGAALPAQLYYGLRSLLSLGSPLSTIRIWRVSCERPCVAAEGALLQFVGATGSQAGVPTAGGLPPGAP